jgi:hypothetical protein
MANLYITLIKQFEDKTNAFINKYCFFAFNNEQFQDGLKEFDLTLDEFKTNFVKIPAGGYMLKDKVDEYRTLSKSREDEIQKQIKLDETGDGFIYDMFLYELNNDEYACHGDDSGAIAMCDLTQEQIDNNPALLKGLAKAKSYLNSLDY